MRHPARSNVIVIVVLALCAALGTTRAWADDPRAEARTHYQAGVKFYTGGDYKSAIREFSSAQQLAPADLNNYNLALCYDKLGDAEPAIQYYKEYLNKVPDAPKRAEIEASVARLEGAVKSSAAKKADEAKKAADAKQAAADAKQAAEAKQAEEAKKAAEDAKHADDASKKPDDDAKKAGGAGGGVVVGGGPAVGVGSTGTPSTGQTVSTGDAQLDRVSAIDVNAIRDQRIGGASSGMPDTRGGPATGQPNGMGGPQPNGMVGANGATGPNAAAAGGGPNPGPGSPDKPAPQETPLYKKWWFWVVVAVGAYVVYEIATQSSQSSVGREVLPLNSPGRGIESGGVTLFHF